MIFVFYILAAVLVWLSFKSLHGGINYLNYFKRELAKAPSTYAPFATVIASCKGLDEDLEANLSALVEQDYPSYEVIFVVDDERDAAVPVIEVLRTGSKGAIKCKLIVAPKAVDSSQKVENLREAILHVSDESAVFVFADSDVRPSKVWLRSLVSALENDAVGAATGYRWFISKRPTFSSELRNIWNASIASALGPNTKDNFCWGGSMAIKRDTFENLDIREKWRGTLSDDLAVTQAMKSAGLQIIFVPQALTPGIEDCTFREMIEFTTRQMKITRVYAPNYWIMSFFGSGLFCFVMFTAFLITIASRQNGIEVIVAISTLLLVSALGAAKSWLRIEAVRIVLKEYDVELKRQVFPQLTLWLISPILFFYNCVAALISRRLVWRGTEYELVSPTKTLIIETKG